MDFVFLEKCGLSGDVRKNVLEIALSMVTSPFLECPIPVKINCVGSELCAATSAEWRGNMGFRQSKTALI